MEINLLKYFTFKRLINSAKIIISFQLSKLMRRPIVWGMPVSYSIEPTNYCNLKCPECPSGLGSLTRPLGLLSFENFKNFVDQIHNTGFYIQLYFQGEPYINKNLGEMISYAQNKNIYISISTNGLLFNEKNVENILSNAPDKLIFSVDGLDEKSYQNYRVGGKFADADASLRLIVKKKKELNLKKPFIEFQFIVMKQNEHMLDEVIKYGKDVGVNKVTFKTMQLSSVENALHFMPANPKYRRYKIIDKELKIKFELKNHCFALWRTSVITWDGRMVPCCFDKDAQFEMGKLNGSSIQSIWKNESYYKFRQAVLNNRSKIEMCKNCTEGFNMNILEIEQ